MSINIAEIITSTQQLEEQLQEVIGQLPAITDEARYQQDELRLAKGYLEVTREHLEAASILRPIPTEVTHVSSMIRKIDALELQAGALLMRPSPQEHEDLWPRIVRGVELIIQDLPDKREILSAFKALLQDREQAEDDEPTEPSGLPPSLEIRPCALS